MCLCVCVYVYVYVCACACNVSNLITIFPHEPMYNCAVEATSNATVSSVQAVSTVEFVHRVCPCLVCLYIPCYERRIYQALYSDLTMQTTSSCKAHVYQVRSVVIFKLKKNQLQY